MFTPSRDQARNFLFDTWAKHQAGHPLTDLEKLVFSVIARHPEYHSILEDRERYAERDYPPELGETNPFLHLSMHLAIEEQLSIDHPHGVRALYETLCQRLGDEHAAQHETMDCLAEMIWQSQRNRLPFDSGRYLDCLRGKAGLAD
ncbi:DUF1841 family protein [Chitinimonas lacunae]|uniref:DUF1841 family protein n=1 Tax=Chitinimonas lacunae TaxID=1963018 RepID=A0ABV8MWJ4_9NEIS